MTCRYLNGSHRPREIAPRGHPIPQLVEVVHLVGCEIVDAHSVHARRSTVRSDLLPRLEDETLRNFKRLQLLLLRSICRLLPRGVDLQTTLNCPAPSLRPHYRALTATTGRSAPVPRIGTLALAVSAACGSPSRGQNPWPFLSGRQVLLFHASACDELTPPIHRAPPGPHTGSSPTEGPPRRAFVPGPPTDPGFDAIVVSFRCVSSGSHMFVFSSHTRPANSETSPAALTTPALDRRSLRWFAISACTATPEDLPPSLAQHRSCRRSSTSSSLPFRTHVGAGNSAVVVDLPRWGPMLSPRVPNLVSIPGPRMERETPGQRPRPNYGHPQASTNGGDADLGPVERFRGLTRRGTAAAASDLDEAHAPHPPAARAAPEMLMLELSAAARRRGGGHARCASPNSWIRASGLAHSSIAALAHALRARVAPNAAVASSLAPAASAVRASGNPGAARAARTLRAATPASGGFCHSAARRAETSSGGTASILGVCHDPRWRAQRVGVTVRTRTSCTCTPKWAVSVYLAVDPKSL